MTDFISFGYEVFPASADIDGQVVQGFAYSDYSDIHKTENGIDYYNSGFVALPDSESDSVFIEWNINDVILEPMSEEDKKSDIAFIYSIEESYLNHYIYKDSYVIYEVGFSNIEFYEQENNVANYDLSLGSIYNYDLGRVVYDPELGYNSFDLSAKGINTFTDYELAMNMFNSYITTQKNNGLEVNSISSSYVSYEAINEYMLNNQEESFLGISAEEIYEFEAGLVITEYYAVAINEETGEKELIKLEFPPPPPGPKGLWGNVLDVLNEWGGKIASVGLIIGGLVVTCFAGLVVGGAMLGAGLELFSQCVLENKKLSKVNWVKVAVATAAGALSSIPGVGIIAAGFISGGLFALESIWEHQENLVSWEAWINVGLDFLDGFQRGMMINSIVNSPVLCFIAGTGIATTQGIKAIENIRKGDLVASYNESTGEVEYKEVKQLFINQAKELTRLKLTEGGDLVSTPTHPYFVVNKNRYIDARNLRAGDILQTVTAKQ